MPLLEWTSHLLNFKRKREIAILRDLILVISHTYLPPFSVTLSGLKLRIFIRPNSQHKVIRVS